MASEKRYRTLWFLLCVLLTYLPAAMAQTPTGQPDVLILVYQVPGGQDQVGVTYAKTVPHAQALNDLHRLQSETHWAANGLQITDAVGPLHSRAGKMTSVSFASEGVAPYTDHEFPVAPFVLAFRNYHQIVLAFVADRGFQFQGLRQYADNHVQIALEQRDSAYTYHIRIIDPQFNGLSLPAQHSGDPATGALQAPVRTERNFGTREAALLIACALAAGVGVYFLTARLGRTR